MFKFHIMGFQSLVSGGTSRSNDPIDITLFATTMEKALKRAEQVLGVHISSVNLRVVAEEVIK